MDQLTAIYNKAVSIIGDVGSLENFLFYIAILPLAFLGELAIVGWNNSSLKKLTVFENSVKTDVFFLFIEIFNLFNLLTVIISFGICHYLAWLFFKATNFDLILNIESGLLQFAIMYVVSDFKGYWSHRLFHYSNTLWKLHEFHHSATDFCILTRYRGHFLEQAMKRFIDVIPYAIFGAPIVTYFAVRVVVEFHQLYNHSSLESKWGFLGKYIFVSPIAHKVHHSVKREHYGKNFGSTLIIWDRLFGTYQAADTIEEIGVPDNEYNKNGVLSDLILTVVNFYRSLRSDVKRLFGVG